MPASAAAQRFKTAPSASPATVVKHLTGCNCISPLCGNASAGSEPAPLTGLPMHRPRSIGASPAVNAACDCQCQQNHPAKDWARIHDSYTRGLLSCAKKKMINTIVLLPNSPAPFACVAQKSIIVIPSQWRRIPNTIWLCLTGGGLPLIQDAGAEPLNWGHRAALGE